MKIYIETIYDETELSAKIDLFYVHCGVNNHKAFF